MGKQIAVWCTVLISLAGFCFFAIITTKISGCPLPRILFMAGLFSTINQRKPFSLLAPTRSLSGHKVRKYLEFNFFILY
jgi:hypothetical protein